MAMGVNDKKKGGTFEIPALERHDLLPEDAFWFCHAKKVFKNGIFCLGIFFTITLIIIIMFATDLSSII